MGFGCQLQDRSENETNHHDGCDGQPGQRRSRTGGTEYEPDVRPAGKRRPVHAADVPVKKTEADNRRNLRKARIKE